MKDLHDQYSGKTRNRRVGKGVPDRLRFFLQSWEGGEKEKATPGRR